MTELRFPLDAAEIETYHRDGVLGPYRLVSPDLMAPMRDRIMAEIINPQGNTTMTPTCTITTAISTTLRFAACAGDRSW